MSITIYGPEEAEDTNVQEELSQEFCETPEQNIRITKDGPYVVSGSVPLIQEAIVLVGGHREYHTRHLFPAQQTYSLCRCGHSKTPPFCDGTHKATHFRGDEIASREPYKIRATTYPGESLYLLDDDRCAFARFCHREDGDVWELTEMSGNERLRHEAIKASSDCPSGRLLHYDRRTDKVFEPVHKPAISILEDPELGVSGPLFVRGGIPLIGSDGHVYELQNRYTLCRCGASREKPFCDATHVSTRFSDGL